ncbi:MAG: viral A-type inclusion protein [Clostridium sp.]
MKNKIIIGIVLIVIIISLGAWKLNENNRRDNENYSMLEFVTSIKEIDNTLPTILFFKSVAAPGSLDAEINLKNLKEEYNNSFNLVHVSLDDLSVNETNELINKYEITEVPVIVALDIEGNLVEKKSLIVSEEGIRQIVKSIISK